MLNRIYEDDLYAREVILATQDSNKPVAYGAIRIFLDRFPEDAAKEIVALVEEIQSQLDAVSKIYHAHGSEEDQESYRPA